jgi:ATP-dependent DNA helicase RecG
MENGKCPPKADSPLEKKMENISLQTPLSKAGRIYKMFASRLEKIGIFTLEDFLYHIPFRYDDFSLISKIAQIQSGGVVTVQGQVLSIQNIYTRRYKKIQKALVNDETGSIEVVWYNQPFLTKYIHVNDTVSLSGKAEIFNHKLTLTSPEYEIINGNNATLHTGRLSPVYPETKGLTSKWLRRQIYKLLQEFKYQITDFIPPDLLAKYNYPPLADALRHIHFPENSKQAQIARERLAFNELLLIQLKSKLRKMDWEKEIKGIPFAIAKYKNELENFSKSLPFELTHSQIKAVDEILQDVTKDKPMNRLLQGDVGSGKTVVGAYIMYIAFLNGYQSVLMAPTEILAQQHFETIKRFLEPYGVNVALATGSKKSMEYKVSSIKYKKNEKNILNTKYQILDTDVLVGTHAILNEKIKFKKLGLVIIDEQQRFGVEQRSIIRGKGNNPHFLTMTATPIPRTVALTMYGDLDISYLEELPKGRRLIKTWLVPPEKREGAYEWIRKHVKELDSQIFIICPFIEESENMQTVKAAAVEYERLRKNVFPDLRLGMLHGKLKSKEKDQILDDFRNKKYDILVATPVVEVGIDIPNATVIMIEAAERFGLAQLHQLRGRVGRGEKQSYCLLFTDSPSQHTYTRLKAMETKHNGAELAELDLKLRGPGDIFGTAQSGLPKLRVATFSDFSLIQQTKHEAESLFSSLSDHPLLEKKVKEITIAKVSPD